MVLDKLNTKQEYVQVVDEARVIFTNEECKFLFHALRYLAREMPEITDNTEPNVVVDKLNRLLIPTLEEILIPSDGNILENFDPYKSHSNEESDYSKSLKRK